MTLGATASALRKVRGLSLSDIQSLTGINKGALSKFERGLEGLGQEKIDRLCLVYHTTPSVLYAVAKAASKDPTLLLDVNKLDETVRKLTKLIDSYLQASDETRNEIDIQIQSSLMQANRVHDKENTQEQDKNKKQLVDTE